MAAFSRFTPLLDGLPATVPFVGPETQERQRGAAFRARLGANESGFGPSPRVVEAMAAEAGAMWKYCDAESFGLRDALSAHLGVSHGNLVIGEGIDGLLGLVVRMIVSTGTPVVTSLGAYPTFNYHVAGFGGRLVTVAYDDEDREDLNGLLEAAMRENAPLCYLANPDNPMGSMWPATEIESFVDRLPPTTMLILDEAYGETAPDGSLPPLPTLLDRPNVIRMRTFSKAYGLAGLRIGYAIGAEETIRAFDKVRNHFGVNRMGQVAAQAALADQNYLRTVVRRIDAAKARISSIAADNGLTSLPSATNFVAIDCGADSAFAKRVLGRLVSRGVFVRMPGVERLNRCIRISAGLESELDILAEELPAALKDT